MNFNNDTGKQVLTMDDIDTWDDFIYNLYYDQFEAKGFSNNILGWCNNDMKHTKEVLELYEWIDVDKTIEYLRSQGGCCDCEVIMNIIDPYIVRLQNDYNENEATSR